MRHPETQPERTALAAHRTAASALVLGFVLLRVGLVERAWAITVLATAALGAALVELVLSHRRYRGRSPGLPGAALALATAVGLISLAGLVASVTLR